MWSSMPASEQPAKTGIMPIDTQRRKVLGLASCRRTHAIRKPGGPSMTVDVSATAVASADKFEGHSGDGGDVFAARTFYNPCNSALRGHKTQS